MSTVIFKCRFCSLSTKNYKTWKEHLVQDGHQAKVRQGINDISLKKKKRSVVVSGVLLASETEVLKYFGDLAVVTDFFYWTERKDFFIVEFLRRSFRNAICSRSHRVNGQEVGLRARDEMTEIEWFSMCPFVLPKIKMEVEDVEMEIDAEPDDFFEETVDVSEIVDVEGFDTDASGVTRLLMTDGNEDGNLKSGVESERISPVRTKGYYNDYMDYVAYGSRRIAKRSKPTQQAENLSSVFVQNEGNTNEDSYSAEVLRQGQLEKDLNDRFEAFYSANLLPPREVNAQRRVLKGLRKLFLLEYPRSLVLPFGAGSTAISSGTDVFSVFVDLVGRTSLGSRFESQHMSGQVRFMEMLVRYLKSVDASLIFDVNVSVNLVTNVENIRLTFAKENMKCEIYVRDFLNVQCSRIVGFLCSLDPRVRLLLIIARHWSVAYRLTQSHLKTARCSDEQLHPELIEWLVLNYLGSLKIIPTVSDLQNSPCPTLFLDQNKVNVGFCQNRDKVTWKKCPESYEVDSATGKPSARSILKLALNMFSYYGKLNYNSKFVSVYRSKIHLRGRGRYPIRGLSEDRWKASCEMMIANVVKPMIVQHPLMLSINMASDVSVDLLAKFKAGCINSLKNIEFMLKGKNLKEPLDVLTPNILMPMLVTYSES